MSSNQQIRIGLPYKEDLKTTLTNCEDPFRAIQEIQDENGIALQTIRPALPLLDLLGVKRLDFHLSVVDDMKERLIKRINDLAQSKLPDDRQQLELLLQKSFSAINLQHVTPIVMEVIKHMPKIPEKYLKYIVEHDNIYSKAPIELKRHIWQDNQQLFQKELQPLIQQYLINVDEQLFTNEYQNYFLQQPKTRRQTSTTIQQLLNMIGPNIKLYDIVRNSLQKLYLRTKNSHYSSLRTLLLMAFHDLENNIVSKTDSIHIFVWTLDASLKERKLDLKRTRELEQFIDANSKDMDMLNKHIPFVLADPNIINILTKTAILLIYKQLDDEIPLPRNNKELHFILRLLNIGVYAWEILDGQMTTEDSIDLKILTQFLPFILRLMMENRLHEMQHDTTLITTQLKTSLNKIEFIQYMHNNRLASNLFLCFIVILFNHRHLWLAIQLIPTLNELSDCGSTDKIFLHQFVYFIKQSIEQQFQQISHQQQLYQYITHIFEKFFIIQSSNEIVLHYSYILLKYVYGKITSSLTQKFLTALKPSKEHSQETHDKYRSLTNEYEDFRRLQQQQSQS